MLILNRYKERLKLRYKLFQITQDSNKEKWLKRKKWTVKIVQWGYSFNKGNI